MQILTENYNKQINEIHSQYLHTISPLIMSIEVLDGEFPIEILNEIRSIFTHLSKCNLSDDATIIERNISKANSHIKRAIIDCFKYSCLAFEDSYKGFDTNYKNVDLSEVDNGEFLPGLSVKRKLAKEKITQAKLLELSTSDENTLYGAYEDAHNAYADVYNLINNSFEKLERIKRKAKIRDIKATIGFVVGIIGTLLGLLGIIIGILK